MANAIVAIETRTPSICNKQLASSDKVAPVVTTSSIRRICFLIKTDGSTTEKAPLIWWTLSCLLSRTKVFVALLRMRFLSMYSTWSCLASCCPNCVTWLYPLFLSLRRWSGIGTTRLQVENELSSSFSPSRPPNKHPSCSLFIYFNWWMSCCTSPCFSKKTKDVAASMGVISLRSLAVDWMCSNGNWWLAIHLCNEGKEWSLGVLLADS